jgi:hypothetical protein
MSDATLPNLSAPPDHGITAWMEENGLYARVYPVPPFGLALFKRMGLMLAAVAVAAVVLVVVGFGPELAQHPWYLVYPAIFVLMISLLQHMSGFFPTEVAIDGNMLVWDSDRIPIQTVGTSTVERSGRLVVWDTSGQEIASIEHLKPDVAAWLADAIRQSIVSSYANP